ncbi:MAG: methyl-accepting chemotaxis protein [Methanoregula sp.]|jgi:methyl-accepting chemotaxis protein|uniref:HAMP domain-containing methyl-accepting chemotaxis protein n=1 Tax=Methanoregula sp. TaxID=2052170 RepID=UPI003D1410BD
MKFIDDMKLSKKMIGGFLVVTAIMIIVAFAGYTSMGAINDRDKEMYNGELLPIDYLNNANAALLGVQGNVYNYILLPNERAASLTTLNADLDTAKKNMNAYRALPLTQEEKDQLALYDSAYAEYTSSVTEVITNVDSGKTTVALSSVQKDGRTANAMEQVNLPLSQLMDLKIHQASDLSGSNQGVYTNASLLLFIATVIGLIVSVLIALFLTRSIAEPVDKVKENIKEIHQGHLSNRLNLNRKDEIGEMADALDKFAVEFQKYILGTMDMVAAGDLSRNLKPRNDTDQIVPPIKKMIETLRAVIEESNKMSIAAVEGKLNVRGDADKFKGGYWEIVAGINKTFDSVVTPLNEGMRISEEYAAGNFIARFDESVKMRGEFKKFKTSLNDIGEQVSKAMRGISTQVTDLAASAEEANASVEEVAAGAGQVAKNAAAVSANADKTTQGIEQVQKAMEDLSRTIQEVANKAEAVARIVDDTTTYSKEGMELAQKTDSGMQGITRSSSDVNRIILEIKGQMDKISEIVNLITDLANQTNLLALNAAIEAARAGDAGRGFAVVATEVKSLAVESRASAEKIAEMIDNLQKQTNHAVDAVSAANTGVREGSAALHDTLASFNKIVSSIDAISRNVTEVAAASEEQAASVEEVTASVSEVGLLMQSTAKESTDSAAASEESSAAIDQITKVIGNVNTIVDQVTKEISRFKC